MERLLGIVATGAVLLSSVSGLLATQANAQAAEEKALVSGWYQDRQVEYYDFGMNTPLSANNTVPAQPIWVFIYGMNADGTPEMVPGQHNIVDVLPGEPGYSDLWQVQMVTVPRDYEPDSITSADEIGDAGFDVKSTDMLVNCPIVPEGTTLEGGEPLVQGWKDGEQVFYPDFGKNPATVAPIWVFIHGMNADGTPDLVEGQSNIIDTVPGQANYTAFWRVNMVTVPANYEPNSIRSAADVLAAGYTITETEMVVNCPVITVAAATTAGSGQTPVSGVPNAGTGPVGASGSILPYVLAAGLAMLGTAGAGAAAMAFTRRRA